MSVINTHNFGQFWSVSWTITQRFRVPERFPRLTNPGVHLRVINTRGFCRYLPVSWTITRRFGVPKVFPWLSNPKVCLCVGRQDSQFGRIWPVSWTITQFWGPEVISMIDEPRGTFKCRSTTLTILANSGPFRGLLLTVLGSQCEI